MGDQPAEAISTDTRVYLKNLWIIAENLDLVVWMLASHKRAPEDNVRPSVRHGRLKRSASWRNLLKLTATGLAVVLVSGASVGAYAFWDLTSSRKSDVQLVAGTLDHGNTDVVEAGALDGAVSILLVGTDSRAGQQLDDGETGELNDVNMLLTISADHTKASVTSFPRDLMLPIPSCPSDTGELNYYPAMSEQPLNSALQYGGLACVALTIQELTKVQIDHAVTIDFNGTIAVSEAVGGVNVCVSTPINDPMSGLQLSAGEHTLEGVEALQFLRSRYGVGDGGDLGRISNQQQFMSNLVKKVKSEEVLTNPVRLYSLAKATIENTSTSTSLTLPTILSIGETVKDIDLNDINFYQFPVITHPYNANKVVPDYTTATLLFEAIQSGTAVQAGQTGPATQVDPNSIPAEQPAAPETQANAPVASQPGETANPSASPNPGTEVIDNLRGQSAKEVTCTTGR
ncbi:LCP family protein [Lysinibacter sp. HNR]|uniref:LCP family protein n=1 Tax=Lysinibacter sp. HNR TaxID=3031408 RepID=UPI002435B553|nr:LCP family protein [Lysinibacter sp. HNR]WGD37546.1 LCP family protein [Lysinibacter sp. HNR]